ncbi:hypothetical protein TD95_000672 [Thielaviopsis punctulata]|uniref:FAD-binding domain-containing protein n=1 Tax=Thielaviopsis punctulata TaxID=72032 RepID=A0A0F4ZHH6_9PEZI|nr:hypothetical protein TD95_000672 [Thielaviopsis punctulata]
MVADIGRESVPKSAQAANVTSNDDNDRFGLDIAIIGAGMGGLGAALALAKKGFRQIHVYETVTDLGFTGAGIQLAPNMARILTRLGCWDPILKEATNGATDETLVRVPMPHVAEKYGFPHCTGHRSSLAGRMYDACKEESAITFHFGCRLMDVKSFGPKPEFVIRNEKGDNVTVHSDILIASDGIKSVTRRRILETLGIEDSEKETGQAAYRIMLNREDMKNDPEMLALIESDEVVRWIGEKRHIIAYPIHNHTIYNLSTTQPDSNFAAALSETYTTRGSKTAMLDVFHDFCPLVQRMLNMVPEGEVCEWRLRMHNPLPTWVMGSVVLIGDACHPTLPHLSQGAAMAIEDGATIAEALALTPDVKPSSISRSLKAYQLLRKEWCTMLVQMAYDSGRVLHLGDGAAKEERDRMFAEAKAGKAKSVPDKWASPDVQDMIYRNDVMERMKAEFETLYAQTSTMH